MHPGAPPSRAPSAPFHPSRTVPKRRSLGSEPRGDHLRTDLLPKGALAHGLRRSRPAVPAFERVDRWGKPPSFEPPSHVEERPRNGPATAREGKELLKVVRVFVPLGGSNFLMKSFCAGRFQVLLGEIIGGLKDKFHSVQL